MDLCKEIYIDKNQTVSTKNTAAVGFPEITPSVIWVKLHKIPVWNVPPQPAYACRFARSKTGGRLPCGRQAAFAVRIPACVPCPAGIGPQCGGTGGFFQTAFSKRPAPRSQAV